MRRIFLTFVTVLMLISATGTASADKVFAPSKGTTERKDILNAVRPLLEARMGEPVQFVVDWMRVYGDWAFVLVSPQRPGGAEINLNDVVYGPDFYDVGLQTSALLKRAYGHWNIVDYAIGATDAYWDGDPLYAQFPKALTME